MAVSQTAPHDAAKAEPPDAARYVWMDGERVPWRDAKIHIMTHSLHYGLAVFEGIRCYKTARGSAVFRLDDHLIRFFRSAKILGMAIPYTPKQVRAACLDLVEANEQEECYIRPLAYFGAGKFGVNNIGAPVKVAIITWKWGAYLGEDGLRKGIRACISSFARIHVNAMMTKAKNSGNYTNSQLARAEAARDGYDEAILLDLDGYVAEGSGENIFIVFGRELETPPADNILEGVTRASVLEIAAASGIVAKEVRISRDRLYCADEAFFSGTAAEITPIREVDHRPIGEGRPGPLTLELQAAYRKAVLGEDPRFEKWLTFVG